jgi:hypothetical protein
MENKALCIEPFIKRAEQYGKLRYELIKLKTIYTVSKVVSVVVSKAIFILILMTTTIILTVGVALWLGDILGKSYYGFFCVAGVYGILVKDVLGSVLQIGVTKMVSTKTEGIMAVVSSLIKNFKLMRNSI